MGAAEGQFPKVDGDILYASEINTFNNKGLILSDDAGPYTENTTTPTLKVTHAVSAGEVVGSIDIFIDKQHNMTHYSSGNNGAREYYIRVDIGETGLESTKRLYFNGMSSSATTGTQILDDTNIFTYEPTTDEKTNGFNIKIYLYLGQIELSVVGAISKIGRTFVRKI